MYMIWSTLQIINLERKYTRNDPIANHVDEAFEKWCDDHKQKEFHFDGRA